MRTGSVQVDGSEQVRSEEERFSDAMAPFTTGGVYLNFEPAEGEERVRAGYGADKYAKLEALKDKWDPDNLFQVNQNIKPSATRGCPRLPDAG